MMRGYDLVSFWLFAIYAYYSGYTSFSLGTCDSCVHLCSSLQCGGPNAPLTSNLEPLSELLWVNCSWLSLNRC